MRNVEDDVIGFIGIKKYVQLNIANFEEI